MVFNVNWSQVSEIVPEYFSGREPEPAFYFSFN